MDKYIRGKVLGKGSFGCAILVTNKLDNKNYVIKEIDISRMPKAERDASEQEAKLLMALNHPNIVRCIECFTHMNKLCIVMDWCSEGDLYGLIQKRRGQQLSEDTILDWLVQMCLGLKHVHDRKILHRDIKTQNVFMSSGGLLKLGDFGVSKVLNSTFQLATTAVGTPYYLSPEICQNRKYNQKSDIWSLGCVLYELATLKHAFEAPNMRALIQKIIKGSYPPMPATRSKELRDLCDRMLTLDWQKRPSINDILATPVMKARIQKFLSATLVAHEFSHTIIHGRPKPGQLVVGGGAGAPPVPATTAAAAAAAGLAPSKFAPVAGMPVGGRPLAVPGAAAAAARPAAVPAVAPGRGAVVGVRASSNSPAARAPAPGVPAPVAAARAGMGMAQARPGAPAVPAPAANAALKQAQDAAVAARAKAAEAAKQREDAMMALAAKRAADAEANAKRELERAKQREVAALGAQREIERLKLEEQRRKLEADKARADADRRKREADRVESERRAKAAEEARARLSVEEAKRARELEAKRKKAEEEARKKDAERAAKEKEREDMRLKIAAQRKEYQDRQVEAARNRAVAEQQLGRGPSPEVQVMAGPRQPRRQWSPPRVEDVGDPAREEAVLGGAAGAGRRGDDALSAEQRRAVWEEQRAAADRNRRAAHEAERHGGIAEFLGVPREDDRAGKGRQQPAAAPAAGGSRPASGAKAATPVAADISPDARRAAYLEMRAAAERNRAQVEGGGAPKPSTPPAGRPVSPLLQVPTRARPVTPTPPVPPRPSDPWAAKMARLEEERRKREQEILEFQKQHWQEVRDARERNKRNIMAEVGNGGPEAGRAQTPPKPSSAATPAAPSAASAAVNNNGRAEEEDDTDFAAMLKDMQDVLMDDDGARNDGDDEEDDIYNDEKHSAALAGHFVLNGQAVALPGVRVTDSLALKVEALRVYLEAALGTDPFLKVYRRLESLSIDDDEGQVSAEFLAVLGPDKLPYLQLVHQLIVCEENMHMEGA
ncbi:hypothetical protein CHLRE_01g001800v5 [Chlamydomonas reinhardtii]|uniref:non-specific serine/threonine protein kinase n=1 Tax=Chlamydomonas reinhardtii TaxID=3055 RepID=A0A2K3E4Q7_CHLRE|nr:uncharacterized protein CHLRE_01g001800v5 [Chlamydomonas reinhardtii]PNW87779.1 hypothetical protein CHLRE_01g001800v5 [Chlamydomonas reinhardtii]